jgi:hypothetical protein
MVCKKRLMDDTGWSIHSRSSSPDFNPRWFGTYVWRFSIFTLVGATIWNTFLLYCGYKLRKNWTLVQQYSLELYIVVGVIGVAALGIWLGVRRFRKKQSIAVKKVR